MMNTQGRFKIMPRLVSHACRTKLWKITFYFNLAVMSGINVTEGIRWISIPSQINKCTGQTANLTWEYVKEANEEIRQLQYRFNTTTLIAYSSEKNGFTVDPKYQGRVEEAGGAGILLKTISLNDIGNYTLYPVISWKEGQNVQSIWLNVISIDRKIQKRCTCDGLPISPGWSGGGTFTIVNDGCSLDINSSFCCHKGPAIECMENDPNKLCVPINLTKNTTQNRKPPDQTKNTTESKLVPEQIDLIHGRTGSILAHFDPHVANTIMLSFLVVFCLCFIFWRMWKVFSNLGRNIQTGTDDTPMLNKYSRQDD